MSSYQFLVDALDQLDLALDQLALSDRNFDRFALMLVDNIVELLLHQFAKDKHSENSIWVRLGKPKYDEKAIAESIGQKFSPKVALAEKLGLASTDEAVTLRNLHEFRNIAYHQGLRRASILHAIAAFYLHTACVLFEKYEPYMLSSSNRDVLPFRARKYIGALRYGNNDKFKAAFQRIGSIAAVHGEESLVADLAADMESVIEHADQTLSFLSKDGREKLSRDDALVKSQLWSIAFSPKGIEFAESHGFTATHPVILVDWLQQNYKLEITKDPVNSWHHRLESLRKETSSHIALKKYCDFMKQTNALRKSINGSAAALDESIQLEIDRLRGK